jgi:hypothetical protein
MVFRTCTKIRLRNRGNNRLSRWTGAGLAINTDGTPEPVWRREGKIYASTIGKPGKENMCEGRVDAPFETVMVKKSVCMGQNGEWIVVNGSRVKRRMLAKGVCHTLKALNMNRYFCVWE